MYGIYRGLITICLFISASFAEATVDCVHPTPALPHQPGVEPITGAAVPYPAIDPQHVTDVFIAAVVRGELLLFGTPLAANALDPHQVEYVYSLKSADPRPTIRVRAVLTPPLPLPGTSQIRATSVTGVLDRNGGIIDLFVHCE